MLPKSRSFLAALTIIILLASSLNNAQPLFPASPVPTEFEQAEPSTDVSGPTPAVDQQPATTQIPTGGDGGMPATTDGVPEMTTGAGSTPAGVGVVGGGSGEDAEMTPAAVQVGGPGGIVGGTGEDVGATPGSVVGSMAPIPPTGDGDAEATGGPSGDGSIGDATVTDGAMQTGGVMQTDGGMQTGGAVQTDDGASGIGAATTDPADEASGSPEETIDEDESISETDESDDGDDVCFPASAVVEVEGGSKKTMRDVVIGDRVLVQSGVYSEVFMFTHKDSKTMYKFVDIETQSGHSVRMTRSHYVPLLSGELVAAGAVKVGDVLSLGNGESSAVVSLKSTKDIGLFNPQTLHGNIVVDGVVASTFTRSVEPTLAARLLAPLRAAYSTFGYSTTVLENGSSFLASLAPSGSLRVK